MTLVADPPITPTPEQHASTAPDHGRPHGYAKCAAAMRQGARQRPQGRGSMFAADGTRSCALGALFEGLTARHAFVPGDDVCAIVKTSTGVDLGMRVPQGTGSPVPDETLGLTIIMLNDRYGWTREAIADWLCTLGDT